MCCQQLLMISQKGINRQRKLSSFEAFFKNLTCYETTNIIIIRVLAVQQSVL